MNKSKILILLLLVVAFSQAFAQQENSNLKKKFSFGVSFSPDYTYRRAIANEESYDHIVDFYNDNEFARFGYTTGIVARYSLNERLAFESGINFSDKGSKTEMNNEDIGLKSTTKFHYYYLGIPLKANYFFVKKKARVFVSGGISCDFYVDDKAKTVSWLNGEKEKSEGVRGSGDPSKTCFVGLFGLGVDYPLSPKFQLRFEPIFRYSFTESADRTDSDWKIQAHPYSIGANIVVFFQK